MNPGVNLFLPAKVTDRIRCASVLTVGARKRRKHWEVEPHHILNGSEIVARNVRGEFFGRSVELQGIKYLHLINMNLAKTSTERQTTGTFIEIEYLDEWRGD